MEQVGWICESIFELRSSDAEAQPRFALDRAITLTPIRSGIRGMFSWSSAPPKSSTVRIRPPDLPRIASTPSRTPTPPVSSS